MNIRTKTRKLDIPLVISSLRAQYAAGKYSPTAVVESILAELANRGDDGIWTHVISASELRARATALEKLDREQFPLWGIPFSVKDCIDVAGLPTSAGCPEFSYLATHTNPAVQKLLEAGAILIGKTNLDQFATGLVGVRTGYTVPHNAFSKDYISGGSSSGAALSVAVGLVSFAIGTDTGGSGRVPAAFNNIVGLKPTRGRLSTAYSVDACKTLDCVSIFALTAEDTQCVFEVAQGFDKADPFSRTADSTFPQVGAYKAGQPFRFGVPCSQQRLFFGNTDAKVLYEEAIASLEALGGHCLEIDYEPFLQANTLLFDGPWVAERYASVGHFVETHPEAIFSTTRAILSKAKKLTAVEAFEGLYAVAALKKKVQPLWDDIDCLVVPTTGTIYQIDEVAAEPLQLNANLGYYTNFVNLLDFSAIAIPNGFQPTGLPAGITIIAPPDRETYLTTLGAVFHRARMSQLGATKFNINEYNSSSSP